MILNEIDNAYVGGDQVDKIYLGNEVVWQSTPPGPVPYERQYLTIEALSGGTFHVKNADIGYSVNGGAWETTTGETALALNQGDTVRFKGNGACRELFSGNTLAFNVYGNIMSLVYGDAFIGESTLSGQTFYRLFATSIGLVSAENLIMPTVLTIDQACYGMFRECKNLTTAPELPATELSSNCYYGMFFLCSSLTTAPELLAPTLVSRCYAYMFPGCSNLRYIKCLATDISATNCTQGWASGAISSSGTFVKKAGVSWSTGMNGIPDGWSVVDAS